MEGAFKFPLREIPSESPKRGDLPVASRNRHPHTTARGYRHFARCCHKGGQREPARVLASLDTRRGFRGVLPGRPGHWPGGPVRALALHMHIRVLFGGRGIYEGLGAAMVTGGHTLQQVRISSKNSMAPVSARPSLPLPRLVAGVVRDGGINVTNDILETLVFGGLECSGGNRNRRKYCSCLFRWNRTHGSYIWAIGCVYQHNRMFMGDKGLEQLQSAGAMCSR